MMLGKLLRKPGVTAQLAKTASGPMINIVVIVNPLMAAMGPNVAGVIGSAVAAGVFLAILR